MSYFRPIDNDGLFKLKMSYPDVIILIVWFKPKIVFKAPNDDSRPVDPKMNFQNQFFYCYINWTMITSY